MILALDVAAGAAAAVLLHGDELLCSGESDSDLPHSQTIMPLLQGLLDEAGIGWHDLDLLAYGRGPGSFTGLRIAAATLSGINASLKLPVLHVSSLAITAIQSEADDVRVIEDARAGEAFVGHYVNGRATQTDTCLSWEEVARLPAGTWAAHNEPAIELSGWQRVPLVLTRPQALAAELCRALPDINTDTLPKLAEPAYLQLSQAERNLQHG